MGLENYDYKKTNGGESPDGVVSIEDFQCFVQKSVVELTQAARNSRPEEDWFFYLPYGGQRVLVNWDWHVDLTETISARKGVPEGALSVKYESSQGPEELLGNTRFVTFTLAGMVVAIVRRSPGEKYFFVYRIRKRDKKKVQALRYYLRCLSGEAARISEEPEIQKKEPEKPIRMQIGK